jgi:hypothetical protein
MVLRVSSFSTADLLGEPVELRAHLRRGQTQLLELGLTRLGAMEARTKSTGGLCHLVEITQHLDLSGQGGWLVPLGTSAQEESRVLQQTCAHGFRALHEGRAQLAHLAAAQLGFGDRRGQAQTILAAAPGDRHQVAHRRMGGDGAAAYVLLDLYGKRHDQGQAP